MVQRIGSRVPREWEARVSSPSRTVSAAGARKVGANRLDKMPILDGAAHVLA